MKLSESARRVGVNYKTVWRWWRAGTLDAYPTASGTVMGHEPAETSARFPAHRHVAIYARVSAAKNRPNVERQVERLVAYCAAKGSQGHQVVKAIGSGVTESRPQFLKVLADPTVERLVVEHKDRATRFGFRSIETLLEQPGRHIEVVNLAENGREDVEDVLADLVAIMYSVCFVCARRYGPRRAKRKTETIVKELTGQDAAVAEEMEVAEDATR